MDNGTTKLTINTRQIIRTPFFSTDACISDNLDILKILIKEASPEFYNSINNIQLAQLDNNFNKVHFTIWKYFNRAKYRAVPFGRFASISVSPEVASVITEEIVLKETQQKHLFRDWGEKNLIEQRGSSLILNARYLVTNSTAYKVGDNIRYVLLNDGQFEINDIQPFEELNYLLKYCSTPREKSMIYEQLAIKFKLNNSSITKLLIQLTDIQMLFTDSFPNIIGEDFFKRLKQDKIEKGDNIYQITERNYISGPKRENFPNEVNELISLLNAHLPFCENPDLKNFRAAFIKKFDRQSVPLNLALDPELGIGYAALETDKGIADNDSFKGVFDVISNKASAPMSLNPLMVFILKRTEQRNVIDLTEFTTNEKIEVPVLPNSLSVLYHQWNGQTIIDHIGGCTANALLGRFTLCGGEFEDLAKQIAEQEGKANPKTVFFDVAYQAEKHIDNVNRRKKIYQFELPLFNWCDSTDLIQLDDIHVKVVAGEVILTSKNLCKRLVPRIPTAYNYTRSDLSVYRFLSDLQHQSIRSDLSLPIRNYIPGQSHYARITYKSFILSPEMWLMDKMIIEDIIKSDLDKGVMLLSNWLLMNNVSICFSAGKGDQNLTFDSTKTDDLSALYLYCRQNHKSAIYLSEAFISYNSGIKSESGKYYNAQLLASLYHEGEIYKADNVDKVPETSAFPEDQRKLIPGSEWLYFEIYCHPSRANVILLGGIKDLITMAKSMIEKWFFIRYRENGNHIRLRIKLKDPLLCAHIILTVNQLFKGDLDSGLISDIQIKTYVRELERYGKIGMPHIESYFHADSKHALNTIALVQIDLLFHQALELIRLLVSTCFPAYEQQLNFVQTTANLFSHEFAFDQKSFKNINSNYESFRRKYKLSTYSSRDHKMLAAALAKMLLHCQQEEDKPGLLADIIHMHINRLFASESRKHEAILYQYLMKDTKRLRMGLKQIAAKQY
jgi:thiopeptide-type bacteriocin biosynthesis protein